MVNFFQKILYILGTISPYTIISSICLGYNTACSGYEKWIIELNKTNPYSMVTIWQKAFVISTCVPYYVWIILAISLLLLIYHVLFLNTALKKLPRMDFYASGTPEENDDFAKGLGVVYLLPIIEWIFTAKIFDASERASSYFLFVIGGLVFLISLFTNKSYGSPVYWLMGYHFHTVYTEESKPYVLMSRTKHFRNNKQIKRVIRLFEDLLIDV